MKSLAALLILIFAALVFVNNFSPQVQNIERVSEKVGASFLYAALLAKKPETKINIPVRNIKAGQIADTLDII